MSALLYACVLLGKFKNNYSPKKSIIQKGLKILIVKDLDLSVIVFFITIQRKVDGTPVKAPINQEVYRICSNNIFNIFIIVLIYLL